MNESPVPGWIATTSQERVIVPAHGAEGYKIAETIKVPAWEDPESGEIYLADEAMDLLESAKARYMGLLSPEQLKSLRDYYGMTKAQMNDLFQAGGRSWSRWESGQARPSRMINLLISALYDGELTIDYFKRKQDPTNCLLSTMRSIPIDKRNQERSFTQFATNAPQTENNTEALLEAGGW
jgi:DNA-binding transcriptional regulator YiaG